MIIIVTFAMNAGLNFVLGLVIAQVLGPEEFGRFAVGSMIAIVLTTAVFEWLRLSTTRFYSERARAEDPSLRATFNVSYLTGCLILAGIIVMIMLCTTLGMDPGLAGPLWMAAVIAAAANGLFEFKAALARSLFLDRAYANLVVVKNAGGFVLMVGAAAAFGDAVWVIGMLALSSVIALIPSRRALHEPAAVRGLASRSHLISFARYGVAIVGANLIYQLIVLVNRSAAASAFGYSSAGQLSLGTDLTLRLMVAVAAALDVFLFQLAVRREATDGPDGADRQLARNMLIVGAFLVLLAVGYVTQLPAFEAAIVPAGFRQDFAEVSLIMVPGVLSFCLGQFAFNPVFQLSGRTKPVVLTAILAGVIDLSLIALMPRSAGIVGFAWSHTTSLVAASVVAGIWAFRIRQCSPPLRDLAIMAMAAGCTFLAIWPLRMLQPPWLALAGAMTIGTAVYAGILLAFDFAGSRDLLRSRLIPARFKTSRSGVSAAAQP